MATTTATLTLSSADLTGDALSLSTTATLTKAGTVTGLDQTTGVARKVYTAAVTNEKLIDKALFSDWSSGDQVAHKVYIKNLSTTATEYVTISFDDGSNTIGIGMLYAGDWCFLPYEGTKDIEVTTSSANMTIEYLVIYEA